MMNIEDLNFCEEEEEGLTFLSWNRIARHTFLRFDQVNSNSSSSRFTCCSLLLFPSSFEGCVCCVCVKI